MAVGWGPILFLYNVKNSAYLNFNLEDASKDYAHFTAVDASGWFVLISDSAIDIYY